MQPPEFEGSPGLKDALGPGPDGAARAAAACARCHALRAPLANFCHECGSRFAGVAALQDAASPAFRAERRLMTILFCDLIDSVSLAAGRDPEDVADAMRQFHAALALAMTRFGGRFERPMGDGALFLFGYPAAAEDDCERAVAAALDAVEAVAALPPQLGRRLQVRIGISTGVVVVGDLLGEADRGGHDVVGDVANLAARLQTAASPGCVLVSDPVHQLTRSAFEYEDLGRARLRGWTEAVQVWRAVRRVRRLDRFGARHVSGPAPLVGRAAEMSELAGAWAKARGGAGGAVLLTGEPGIGKSRLLHELAASLAPAEAVVVRYSCAPMQQEAALHPAIDELAQSAGLSAGDSREARSAKIAAALADCPEADRALIAGLIAPELTPAAVGLRDASPDRVLDALLDRLARIAADRPVAVVVEDAHWSDPTTRALLARIATAAPARALLLVVTARPQFRPDWAFGAGAVVIHVDPLPPDDSERLARASAGPVPLSDEVVADIVARSDGVPLFVEEVTRTVIESGGSDHDVPASIHASLLSRIDRLGRARAVAETAATIGRAFDLELLTALSDAPPAELSQDLRLLMDSGLVRPDGDRGEERNEDGGRTAYAFRHALIRDTIYGTIVRRRRRALHVRIAETMERDFAAVAATHPQQLALHYAAGALDQRAAAWWLRAGLQSMQRSATKAAFTQLRRALSMLDALADSPELRRLRLEVLVVYGRALIMTEGAAAAVTRDVFARARTLCEQIGDPPELPTVLFSQWTEAFFAGRMATAEEQGAELLSRARRGGDDVCMFMGCYTLGLTRMYLGRPLESAELLREAASRFNFGLRDIYARPSVSDPYVTARCFLGWGAMMRGTFSEAGRECAEAIAVAQGLGQRGSIATAVHMRFYVGLELHGPDGADERLRDYEEAAAGVEHYEAFAQIVRAWTIAERGEFERALELSRGGRDRHAASGTRLNEAHCLLKEAEMLLGLGRLPDAEDVLDAAKRVQTETGAHWDDAEFHRIRAGLLLARGRAAGAEAELLAAERAARGRGQHLFGLRAGAARARLLLGRGRSAEAGALLRGALALVEPGSSTRDAAGAGLLLAGLDPA